MRSGAPNVARLHAKRTGCTARTQCVTLEAAWAHDSASNLTTQGSFAHFGAKRTPYTCMEYVT
jgi:hypothetical protein